ncbi:mechanosensitive ion channel family protein [Campylobacter corcagiensis]|uniref:Mechanosensitive ion channel family protein n=1 Tax=Campylobacter corcagiensis TaxID=1448857 RepID=A0A7M1LH97_9BACT|nr:mechanosensitive ion channel family protein [Campylobacter corcagiensis]QKF65487.1 small conductance mechanosensitive channel protein [Campylobacter corcagiensis]QOQ87938.1 mechanosensitive ion channel family protein [Campylobacter corcagiensis]
MKKFITKFLLISMLSLLYAGDNATVDLNLNETNKTESNKTSILDLNVSSVLKQEAPKLSEENKTAEKERIVELLTSVNDDGNVSEESKAMAELVAEKAVNSVPKDPTKRSVFDIVMDLKDINIKIELLKNVNKDTNASSSEIEALNSSKTSLLNEIPAAITGQVIDEKTLINYLASKKDIKDRNDKNKNKPKSFDYIESSIDLSKMETAEIFYGVILRLEKLFSDGASEREMKNAIQDPYLKIQLFDLAPLKESVENFKGSEEETKALKDKYDDLVASKKIYEEVLDFLNKKSNLLSTSALFTGLNMKFFIDYINDKSPFNPNKINLGKIIPIIFIMVILFSTRKFLANIIYFVFSFFIRNKEQSESIKTQVIDLIKKPMGILLIAYGVDICTSIFYYPNPVPLIYASIFNIVYIVLYAWLVIEIIDGFGIMIISKLANKGSRKEVLNLVVRLLYIVVVVVAILLILSNLGVNVSAIVASLGIGGIAVALATKDMIANLFASVMVLFDNSFSQGDWIVVGGVEGTVVETGLRKTTIRTFDNALIFVPNSTIIGGNIINWSRRKMGRQIKMYLEIDYASSREQIESAINEIRKMLMEHPGIAKSAQSNYNNSMFKYRQNIVSIDDLAGYKSTLFVCLDSFADSSINIMVYCFTKSVIWGEFLEVKQDVMLRMMDILAKNKLDFAYPSQSLYIKETPKDEDFEVIDAVKAKEIKEEAKNLEKNKNQDENN